MQIQNHLVNSKMTKYSKAASYILVLFIFLSCFLDTRYFISVAGLSIRPIYFLFPVMLLYIPRRIKKSEFNTLISHFSLFYISILTGLFASVFAIFIKIDNSLNMIFLAIIQLFIYFIFTFLLLICDKDTLSYTLGKIIPLITIPPFLIYLLNVPVYFGERIKSYPGIYIGSDGLPRLTGFCNDPNYFALYMMGVLFIYVVSMKYCKFEKRGIYLYLIIGVIDILLTVSRSAIMSLVLFLIFCGLFNKKRKVKILTIVFIVFIIIILMVLFLFIPTLEDMLFKKTNLSGDGSVNERSTLLLLGLKSIYLYPFGIGIGNQTIYYQEIYGLPKLSHNDFISVLIECGVIGLLSYILMFLILFLQVKDKMTRICIFCFVVFLCTLSAYNYNTIVPIFVLLMSYFSCILPKRDRYEYS
jgi:O-antigen ligase